MKEERRSIIESITKEDKMVKNTERSSQHSLPASAHNNFDMIRSEFKTGEKSLRNNSKNKSYSSNQNINNKNKSERSDENNENNHNLKKQLS